MNSTLKKSIIPITLAAIIAIAGIFSALPIEKATTVHSTLPSTTSVTTQGNSQDEFVTFRVNFTNMPKQKVTLIPADSGTITGFATLTALSNSYNNTIANVQASEKQFQCGLSTTNSERLGINATQGNSTSLALSAVLSANEGIVLEAVNSTNRIPGTCVVTLIIDSSNG